MKKGGEARQKTELERCDLLRDTNKKPIMAHEGFKLEKPGHDAKKFQMFMNIFMTRPKLAKFLMAQMMKGQLDCAMMTDLQMQEAE